MNILGLSFYYHDSAATLVSDNEIIFACQEERFTRKKNDSSFPRNSLNYILENYSDIQIDAIAYYENPNIKFSRWLKNYYEYGRNNYNYEKLNKDLETKFFIEKAIREYINLDNIEIFFIPHHLSHAASTFYPSNFDNSSILIMDGVGEWSSTSIGYGKGSEICLNKNINYPHSLGLLYSSLTYFCGFKVNSGEYKLMGLAPYGEPIYKNIIYDHLIDVKEDGSYELNLEFFNFYKDKKIIGESFEKLFKISCRNPESMITKKYMDIAASIQNVIEEIIIKLVYFSKKNFNSENLCLAGGVALNCVANGKILKEKVFKNIWIQPASGDAGGALGAALALSNKNNPKNKKINHNYFYLGPKYHKDEILNFLEFANIEKYSIYNDDELSSFVSNKILENNVIGLFKGRLEFGPRALGSRSILANAADSSMQSKVNLKIKYRESFRPFAPILLRDDLKDLFGSDIESPYMLFVHEILDKYKNENSYLFNNENLIEVVNQIRSCYPAITHVDFSSRIQTVTVESNPFLFSILTNIKKSLKHGICINTSFNLRNEPIVANPEDALRCFLRSEIDFLVLENIVIDKRDVLDKIENKENWEDEFELD